MNSHEMWIFIRECGLTHSRVIAGREREKERRESKTMRVDLSPYCLIRCSFVYFFLCLFIHHLLIYMCIYMCICQGSVDGIFKKVLQYLPHVRAENEDIPKFLRSPSDLYHNPVRAGHKIGLLPRYSRSSNTTSGERHMQVEKNKHLLHFF